jgi:hypothetical protein
MEMSTRNGHLRKRPIRKTSINTEASPLIHPFIFIHIHSIIGFALSKTLLKEFFMIV